jgi:cell wall-associated NlpC family hydrolase
MANNMALRQAFLAEIQQFEGNLYHFGGKSPGEGFDCSGLLTYCGQQTGVDLGDPLMTNADGLKGHCVEVDPGEALLGDLILFHNTFPDPVTGQPFPADYATHCGASLGAGTLRMWDTHENEDDGQVPGVGETNIGSPFWQGHFLGVWRPTAFLAEEAANGDAG